MTPQQANELPKLPAPFGSIDIYTDDGMVRSVDGFTADQMRGYALDYARRAPAPTEPAVDRDIGQLNTYWLTADGVADQFVRVSDVQAYLATPASPAVPEPIEQAFTDALMGGLGVVRIDPSTMFEPQVAQASQPTSAEELQQTEHIPPFAEPASQHDASVSSITDPTTKDFEMTNELAKGGFACPICGRDKPHSHPDEVVAAYRDDQIRNDGWISAIKVLPVESGWYLCSGVELLKNESLHQLDWFNWVRDLMKMFAPLRDIPEVLYFDRVHQAWFLRNALGNAVPSGRENRNPVWASVKLWRSIPEIAATSIAKVPT